MKNHWKMARTIVLKDVLQKYIFSVDLPNLFYLLTSEHFLII